LRLQSNRILVIAREAARGAAKKTLKGSSRRGPERM
jgi:hypothetical protein